MTTFTVPTRDQVSPASQAAFDGLQKALGFVPNLYATFALSDNALPKYLAYQGAKTSLSNREKVVVDLIVSEINECRYCQSAHTAIGKMNSFSDDELIDIRRGHSTNAKLNALVTVAKEITENKGRVSPATLDTFYAAGYTNANLVDVIAQVGEKITMNYLHNLTGIPIDFPVAPLLEAEVA
jgi:uncharacterized peroxidase-related enzyme